MRTHTGWGNPACAYYYCKGKNIPDNTILSNYLKINSLGIHYLAGGQGDPLIIIHGGGDGAKVWEQNAKLLAKSYCVYVPDLPGFGYSQSTSNRFQLPEYSEFIENFANTIGLKRFNLLGHSIGGGIALHYALKYPHKVKGLILVSSWCLGKEAALWIRFFSLPIFCSTLGKAIIAVCNAAKWLSRLCSTSFTCVCPISPIQLDIGRTMVTLEGQTTVLFQRLSELIMPTLVVWGGRDIVVPSMHAYAAAQVIPDCQVHVLNDCGHSVFSQKITEFSHILTKFLDRSSRRP